MEVKTNAIERLHRIFSELDRLQAELRESEIEATAVSVLQDDCNEMRTLARTLQQGLERVRLTPNVPDYRALLVNERMARASQLNIEIGKDIAAGRIKTDHAGISVYLRVLNQVMKQLDIAFGSRNEET